jgi:uncharacterized membrane protein (UPF0127 family)
MPAAWNKTRRSMVGTGIRVADTFVSRLRGLLLTKSLGPGEGLWITPCTSIHSFGMRFVFDALFLGTDWRVVGLVERFRRNRMSRVYWNALGVLELPAGTIERTGTEVGDEIRFET